jgi:hypothetical protein
MFGMTLLCFMGGFGLVGLTMATMAAPVLRGAPNPEVSGHFVRLMLRSVVNPRRRKASSFAVASRAGPQFPQMTTGGGDGGGGYFGNATSLVGHLVWSPTTCEMTPACLADFDVVAYEDLPWAVSPLRPRAERFGEATLGAEYGHGDGGRRRRTISSIGGAGGVAFAPIGIGGGWMSPIGGNDGG